MSEISRGFFWSAIWVAFFSMPAQAQGLLPNGLIDWTQRPGSTSSEVQRATAVAVETICVSMVTYEDQSAIIGSTRQLNNRCNEIVGNANFLMDGGSIGLLADWNANLQEDELNGALQGVAGEELHGNTTLSTRVTNGQFANISSRMNALRLGNANAAIGGRLAYADPADANQSSPSVARVSFNEQSHSGGGAAADIAGSRWGWFVEGSFNTGDRDLTDRENSFDFDSTSFTLGLDYLMDTGVIGVSIGMDNFEADFKSSPNVTGGDLDIEATSGTLFGAWNRGNVFFNGLVSFGNMDNDSRREAIYAVDPTTCVATGCNGTDTTLLVGSTEGEFLSGGATLGIDFNRGNWDISTTLSATYRDMDIDGYTETDEDGMVDGGLSLAYADQTIESFRTILAIAFTGTYSRDFGILSPHFRLEWHHEFRDDPTWWVAKYAEEDTLFDIGVPGAAAPGQFSMSGGCLSCFAFASDDVVTDFGVAAVGLSAVFSQRVQIYGVFETLLGYDDLSSNSISAGFRAQF
jgi:uncharacterized protein YhjY with autotransporter beta-barrel domain